MDRQIGNLLAQVDQFGFGHRGGLPGADQVRLAAHGLRGQHIAWQIAHHGHPRQGNAKALPDHLEQAGQGLAASALVFGGVGAEEHGLDPAAMAGQQLVHARMHGIEGHHVEQTPANARLVGGHDHVPTGMVEPRNRFQRTGQRHPLVCRLDVVVPLVIDGSVAIEDDEFHAHSERGHAANLDRSATRFMAWCKDASKPRRLVRNAASSALTMTPSKKASTGAFKTARACKEAV